MATATDIIEPGITPKQLEKILQVSGITLAKWRSDGKGPRYFKCGKLVRYTMSAVHEWRERNTHGPVVTAR